MVASLEANSQGGDAAQSNRRTRAIKARKKDLGETLNMIAIFIYLKYYVIKGRIDLFYE